MTPRRSKSKTDKHLDALMQETVKKFNIPPSILGAKPRGRKPKFTKAKIQRMLFKWIEEATGKKLHAYQKAVLVTLWEAYPDLPVSFGKTSSEFPSCTVKLIPPKKP